MTQDALLRTLRDEASRRFRNADRFAYHYARSKLAADPIFRAVLQSSPPPSAAHWLDLGCGQGSLFAWLLAARRVSERGDWPADWSPPPQPRSMRGIELMRKDVQRAAQAFAAESALVQIEEADMTQADFGQADVVTLFDALHYLDFAQQEQVLRRVRAALPPGGLFLTRVGDAGAGLPFHLCKWIDRIAMYGRGHRVATSYHRRLPDWVELLRDLGFTVTATAIRDRKPFANVLLDCRAV